MKAPAGYPEIVQDLLDAAGAALTEVWAGMVESDFDQDDEVMAVDDTLQAIALADQTLPAELVERLRTEYAAGDGITEQEAERITSWLDRIRVAVNA